jgi:hypothetical protein
MGAHGGLRLSEEGATMNVWGKVFLGLTIVLAATDAYLVTVLHAHRNKW